MHANPFCQAALASCFRMKSCKTNLSFLRFDGIVNESWEKGKEA
jgi:hypothetical protein